MAMITLGTIAAITTYKQYHDGLGNLRFNTTLPFRGQAHFIKGLKYLNLFAREEAVAEFKKASEFDPDFVMAKVGTALAYKSHLGYGSTDNVAGRKVLAAINCNSTETCKISNHELGYLNAAKTYFNSSLTEMQQLERYSIKMQAIMNNFPKDGTAAAMYASSLLSIAAASPPLERIEILDKASDLLEHLFEAFPQHPGVLLGMVQAFDSPKPEIAQHALRASKKISRLVYKSSIALHAASHISQTLGNYSDVLLQNQRAYTNSMTKCSGRHVPLVDQDKCDELVKFMSLEWMHNSYLMKCEYAKGLKVLDDFELVVKRNPKYAPFQAWLLRMYARQVFGSKRVVRRISHSVNVGKSSWIPASIEGEGTSSFWDSYSEAGALLARGQDIMKSETGIREEDSRTLLIISNRLLSLLQKDNTPFIRNAIMSMHFVHLASTKFFDCKERVCAEESIELWNRAVAIEIDNKRDRNAPILPFESILTLYSAFITENLAYFKHSLGFDVKFMPTAEKAIDLLQESIGIWGPRTKTIVVLHKVTNENPIQHRRWSLHREVVFKTLVNYNINPQCLI